MTETEAIRENYNLGVIAGEAREQQRIIKLLEASAMAWSENCAMPIDWKHCQNCWQMASLIALIKGEK